MQDTQDPIHFKQMLENEKRKLEQNLSEIGRPNASVEGDWEVTAPDIDILPSDRNEVADKMEEMEEHSMILDQLESQYNEVLAALLRIEAGTYGVCEQCGKPIAPKRLAAYPAARTCTEHA
jgi:DnaK suppressor protein